APTGAGASVQHGATCWRVLEADSHRNRDELGIAAVAEDVDELCLGIETAGKVHPQAGLDGEVGVVGFTEIRTIIVAGDLAADQAATAQDVERGIGRVVGPGE